MTGDKRVRLLVPEGTCGSFFTVSCPYRHDDACDHPAVRAQDPLWSWNGVVMRRFPNCPFGQDDFEVEVPDVGTHYDE